ncbi:MAG: LytTR family DNA-binding domain-containing protein [Bacillales bacterium]|nr:LytTR family DNA-binding domain-containing protein [Bacillales bacterium]
MKCQTIIDEKREEEVLIYAQKRSSLVDEIERLVESNNLTIKGTKDDEIIIINPLDVTCFISQNNKVFALIGEEQYKIKERLYQLEEMMDENYIKINQSCLANIKRIDRFSSSLGGAIMVLFDNGYKDYISRRELKKVKERMGL